MNKIPFAIMLITAMQLFSGHGGTALPGVAKGFEHPASEVCSLWEYFDALHCSGCPLSQDDIKQELKMAMVVVEQTPSRMQEFLGVYNTLQLQSSLSKECKVEVLEWMKREVEKHPENLGCIIYPWPDLGMTLADEDVHGLFRWFECRVEDRPEFLNYLGGFCNANSIRLTAEEKQELVLRITNIVKSESCDLPAAVQVLIDCGIMLNDQVVIALYEAAFSSTKNCPSPKRVMAFLNFVRMLGGSMTQADLGTLHEKMRDWMINGKVTLPDCDTKTEVTVTNVSVQYVLNSIRPEFAIPATSDTGFVNVIAEVKGGVVAIPSSWAESYPSFESKFDSDFTKALSMKTGKKDGAGNDMFVWQDYIAGTDPTKPEDKFMASITVVEGKVTVSYTPELDDARKALRKYTTWGKKSLLDANWTEVQEGHEAEYNFFKVSVEMK